MERLIIPALILVLAGCTLVNVLVNSRTDQICYLISDVVRVNHDNSIDMMSGEVIKANEWKIANGQVCDRGDQ